MICGDLGARIFYVSLDGFDSHAHHLLDFLRRERIQLAGAAGGDQTAKRMARHFVHIARERVEVERKILAERSDWKSEDTPDAISE